MKNQGEVFKALYNYIRDLEDVFGLDYQLQFPSPKEMFKDPEKLIYILGEYKSFFKKVKEIYEKSEELIDVYFKEDFKEGICQLEGLRNKISELEETIEELQAEKTS